MIHIEDLVAIEELRANFVVSDKLVNALVKNVVSLVKKDKYHYTRSLGLPLFSVDDDTSDMYCDKTKSIIQECLFNNQHYSESLKRVRPDGSFMKVIIAPITIFTDDTSGNLSKQYNVFDSYVMTPAAMAFDARGSKNNTFFICSANKSLSAVDMLPALVEDLSRLENGIEMYSEEHGDYILVVAPLLMIQADNHRQSELVMHKGSGARCCCKKCFFPAHKNPNPKLAKNASKKTRENFNNRVIKRLEKIVHVDEKTIWKRTKKHLLAFANLGADTDLGNKLSFVKNGSEALMILKAFEGPLDTPTEILHTVLLGVVKFLCTFLWKKVLTSQADKDKFQAGLSKHRSCQAYSRSFRLQMKHNGSFVGRDYKQLVQIFPVVLRDTFDFQNNKLLRLTAKCFEIIGLLCSLLYMRSIRGERDVYLVTIQHLVDQFTEACLELDNHSITLGIDHPLISIQPKTHFLHHIVDDIIRFGPAVHFETEHGEQYNKFIREAILHTNRHFSARDITFRFARQFVIRHLINGGSFLVKKLNDDGTNKLCRAEIGLAVKDFLDVKFPNFKESVLQTRENSDNNDYIDYSLSVLKVGTSGFFLCSSAQGLSVSIARICREETLGSIKAKYLQCYQIAKFDQFKSGLFFNRDERSELFPAYLVNEDNNIVLEPVGSEILLDDSFEFIQHLDIDVLSKTKSGDRLLNVHKFGTLWTMLRRDASSRSS